jgi:hypothetical protein
MYPPLPNTAADVSGEVLSVNEEFHRPMLVPNPKARLSRRIIPGEMDASSALI